MLNKQDYFDKRVRQLAGELRELRRRRYIVVPLQNPIQRGWRRFHTLAPAAEKRADKEVLTAILEVIGTSQYRRSPNFRKTRSRRWQNRYVELEQPVRVLTAGEWNRRKLPAEWLRYFRREVRSPSIPWIDVLIFTAPYVFELKIEPSWISESCVADPIVEQRMAEIERWLWHHNAMPRLSRLEGGNRRWRDPTLRRKQARIAQRETAAAYYNFPEVELNALTQRIRLSRWFILFHPIPRRSPTSRGTPLRTEPVRVQLLPPGPLSTSHFNTAHKGISLP